MGKCKLFVYRAVHFVLRHIATLDSKIEKRIQAATQISYCSDVALPGAREEKDPFFASIRIITHAGGGLQGQSYLNCVEAPESYYARGNRTFEFDVVMTADNRYVLSHSDVETTQAEFLAKKIDRRFSTMSVDDVLTFMKVHEDIKVIFDCKCENLDFAKYLYENAEETVRSRMVIQVFKEQDILDIKEVWDFKMLYVCMMATDYRQVALHCLKHGIGAVSIACKALQERTGWELFAENNICAFSYTVNTLSQYDRVIGQGLTGVFSDFLLEKDVGQEDDNE